MFKSFVALTPECHSGGPPHNLTHTISLSNHEMQPEQHTGMVRGGNCWTGTRLPTTKYHFHGTATTHICFYAPLRMSQTTPRGPLRAQHTIQSSSRALAILYNPDLKRTPIQNYNPTEIVNSMIGHPTAPLTKRPYTQYAWILILTLLSQALQIVMRNQLLTTTKNALRSPRSGANPSDQKRF